MEWLINNTLPVVAKFCLVVLFPFSALDKIVNWNAALQQANSSILPGGPALLILAMIVEFVMPVCIVIGWYEGWAALILAFFCVVTAVLYHNFWDYPRFWSPSSEGRAHVWDFLKNFGLAGGLLLVVLKSDLPPKFEHMVEPASSSMKEAHPE